MCLFPTTFGVRLFPTPSVSHGRRILKDCNYEQYAFIEGKSNLEVFFVYFTRSLRTNKCKVSRRLFVLNTQRVKMRRLFPNISQEMNM